MDQADRVMSKDQEDRVLLKKTKTTEWFERLNKAKDQEERWTLTKRRGPRSIKKDKDEWRILEEISETHEPSQETT